MTPDEAARRHQQEFAETLGRIRDSKDHSLENQRPGFDPVLHRDVVADAKHGRTIEMYRRALERLGFRYYSARELGPYVDGQPRAEGEWRFRMGQLRLAFTSDEICAKYPGGPEEFYTEVDRWQVQERARQAGIILPR